MSGRDHRVIDGVAVEAGRTAGQGAAVTDRGVAAERVTRIELA